VAKKRAKRHEPEVEWLSERAVGHSNVEMSDGRVFVEMRLCGEVMIDGQEYSVDEVLQIEAQKCNIKPDGEIEE